jgi:hypothetical protein
VNLQVNRAFILTLVAGAAAIGASQAKAETYTGTFNLPVETYWGGAVLSPGEYSLVIEQGIVTPIIHLRDDDRQVASVLAGPAVNAKPSVGGRLLIANINGSYVVKQFDAGIIGKSFQFATPKSIRNQATKTTATAQTMVDVVAGR